MTEQRGTGGSSMWDGGDYGTLAPRFAPAAQRLADALADGTGPVLDLAAGTGSVAAAVARSGRRVVALDSAPGLVEQGLARTAGLPVDWVLGDMVDIPVDERFDAVLSSFGLIFADDPGRAFARIHEVLVPGGVLAFTAWRPDGYFGQMSVEMARALPAAAAEKVTAWVRWGADEMVPEALAAAGFDRIRRDDAALPWRFADADAATDFLFENSPGHAAALAVADPDEVTGRVREHVRAFAGAGAAGPVDAEAAYVVWTARRA